MSSLVIGLVAGLVVGALLVFCCVRSICKEKSAIERQVKQVQQVDEDQCYDEVEAPTPPLEDTLRRPPGTTTGTVSAKTTTRSVPAPAHEAPPSYDELHADATTRAGASGAVKKPVKEDFEGRQEYQAAGNMHVAPASESASRRQLQASTGASS